MALLIQNKGQDNAYQVKTNNGITEYNSEYLTDLVNKCNYTEAAKYLSNFKFLDNAKQQQLEENIRMFTKQGIYRDALYKSANEDQKEAMQFLEQFGNYQDAYNKNKNNHYFNIISDCKNSLIKNNFFDKNGNVDMSFGLNLNYFYNRIDKKDWDSSIAKADATKNVNLLTNLYALRYYDTVQYNKPLKNKICQDYEISPEEFDKYCYTKDGSIHIKFNKNDANSDNMLVKIANILGINYYYDFNLLRWSMDRKYKITNSNSVKINNKPIEKTEDIESGPILSLYNISMAYKKANDIKSNFEKLYNSGITSEDDDDLQLFDGTSINLLSMFPDLGTVSPDSEIYNRRLTNVVHDLTQQLRNVSKGKYQLYSDISTDYDDGYLRPIMDTEDQNYLLNRLASDLTDSENNPINNIRGMYANGKYGLLVTLAPKEEIVTDKKIWNNFKNGKEYTGKRIKIFIPGLASEQIQRAMENDTKFESKGYLESIKHVNGEYVTEDGNYSIQYKNNQYQVADLNNPNSSYTPIDAQTALNVVNSGILKIRMTNNILSKADANGKSTTEMEDYMKRASVATIADLSNNSEPLKYLDGTEIKLDDIFKRKIDMSKINQETYNKILQILDMYKYYSMMTDFYLNN